VLAGLMRQGKPQRAATEKIDLDGGGSRGRT
jgi:hypothetical protein